MSAPGDTPLPVSVKATLSGAALPSDGALRRNMPRAPHRRTPDYVAGFDAHTLVFDCFHDPLRGCVTLVCPRLLNLWPALRDGITIDGTPVRPKRKTHIRTDTLRIPVRQPPNEVTLTLGGQVLRLPVGAAHHDAFAGLNTMVAVNKNNRPEWVREWARYHVAAHGAEGIVLFDNGSTDYPLAVLEQALAGIPGLKVISVIAAPYPYGPIAAGGHRWETSSRYFQTGMLNTARLRFLARARAVLSVDIDEMVIAKDGARVFDATVASRLGLLGFEGRWAYVQGARTPQPQSAHVWRTPKPRPANTKWCVAPGGVLGRAAWQVHKVCEPLFPLAMTRKFSFLHCRATSTGWKRNQLSHPKELEIDPGIVDLFARYLPPEA